MSNHYHLIQTEIARHFLSGHFVDVSHLPLSFNISDNLHSKLVNAKYLQAAIPCSNKTPALRLVNSLNLPTKKLFCIEPVDNNYNLIAKNTSKSVNGSTLYVHSDRLNNSQAWDSQQTITFIPKCTDVYELKKIPRHHFSSMPFELVERNEYPDWAVIHDFRLQSFSNQEIVISYAIESMVWLNTLW